MTITGGNVNDRSRVMDMVKGITGKLIGDKGYISKKLCAELFEQKVTLITKIKKNMKNILMDTTDKMMLMRRSFIETIFSSMKSLNTLIHSRHRSPINAFSHLFAGLINYQIRTDKPSLEPVKSLLINKTEKASTIICKLVCKYRSQFSIIFGIYPAKKTTSLQPIFWE